MNILVAEDNPISAKMLQEILSDEGYTSTLAEDGAKAWACLQEAEELPTLAILDWMMPEIDGVELCRMIRADERFKNIYVLILSALDRKEEIVVGLKAGANDYVTKPFNLIELKARIAVGVRMATLERELATPRKRA